MYSPPVKSSSKPVKSRLGLKLAALFTGTFLIVSIGLLFIDLLASMADRLVIDAAVSNQPAVTAIDPKIEADLAKVLETSDVQKTAEIKNPFADQTGISEKFDPAASSTQPASAVKTAANPAALNNPQRNLLQQNLAARTVQPAQTVKTEPQMDTKTRLQIREERIRLGQDGGPEGAVYSIDDLLPVGVVGGGDGKDEVMFYSEAACRVVSFPVGTQFFDGWFDSLRPEGVVFGFFDQYRTMRMRAWGRSVKQGCSQSNFSETNLLNQAETSGGGD
jgi:hypothetical protein